MIIRTHDNSMYLTTPVAVRIKVKEDCTPAWDTTHKRYYVPGYRWIKARNAWSGSCLVHSFCCWMDEAQLAGRR